MQAQWHLAAAMPLVCTPPKHEMEKAEATKVSLCIHVLYVILAVTLLRFIIK